MILDHLPAALHWPFSPGVFIAVLAFTAAVVVFREKPKPLEKAIWILVFGALMCSEIWMVSLDRDARDKAEGEARSKALKESSKMDILILHSTTAIAQLGELKLKMEAAKSDPVLMASIKKQIDEAQTQSDVATLEVAFAMLPSTFQQAQDIAIRWYQQNYMLDLNLAGALKSAESDPSKQQRLKEANAAQRHDLATISLSKLRAPLQSANFIRLQLLKKTHSDTQADEDVAAIFGEFLAGQSTTPSDVVRAVRYLLPLAKKAGMAEDLTPLVRNME